MRVLSLDIETYSSVDLNRAGVYAYTSAPDFEILLLAYAFDSEAVSVVDLAGGERLPEEVLDVIMDDNVIKSAFNAQFERVALSRYLKTYLSPVSWRCTEVLCSMLGLPLSLDKAAEVMKLKERKMREGRDLIRYFSVPDDMESTGGQKRRNNSTGDAEKWERFKQYCLMDVEVERSIREVISNYISDDSEKELYALDQRINDRGILVDMVIVDNAIKCSELFREESMEEAKRLTGLKNPNSVAQLKGWLSGMGMTAPSLSKKNVEHIAQNCDGEVKELLELRLQLSKTSVKKYEAIKRAVCSDGRVRGLLQFYGASRTGRWAGRLVQVQNLPQNHMKDLDLARNLLKEGSFDSLKSLFKNVPAVLSELIRTAFIPKEGCKFLVADYSAIEARVLSWLAGERWRLEVFSSHGKIYEASASRMFKVPIESIEKGSSLRQKGKIAELALGYGGSIGALMAMGALDAGLKLEELKPLVDSWRASNPNITRLWREVEDGAKKAILTGIPKNAGRIGFSYKGGILFITLPSGRKLSYIRPMVEMNGYIKPGLFYEGVMQNKAWGVISTYGAKLVENIVQGVSRDILANAMLSLEKSGYRIVMHVHDEIVIEAPKEQGSIDEVCGIMGIGPSWAKGLPLLADGYECGYYIKK